MGYILAQVQGVVWICMIMYLQLAVHFHAVLAHNVLSRTTFIHLEVQPIVMAGALKMFSILPTAVSNCDVIGSTFY